MKLRFVIATKDLSKLKINGSKKIISKFEYPLANNIIYKIQEDASKKASIALRKLMKKDVAFLESVINIFIIPKAVIPTPICNRMTRIKGNILESPTITKHMDDPYSLYILKFLRNKHDLFHIFYLIPFHLFYLK